MVEGIEIAVRQCLHPVVTGAPDLDLYPISELIGDDDHGKSFLPIQLLRRDSLHEFVGEVEKAGCTAPADAAEAVAAPPRKPGYRSRLEDGCQDYIHFDQSSDRALKVALHELRWRRIEAREFFQNLIGTVEEVPDVQRWHLERHRALDHLDATLAGLRRKIRDPS